MATKKVKISIMVQDQINGPWSEVKVEVNPRIFLEYDTPEIKTELGSLAANSFMGGSIIDVDYRYTKEEAQAFIDANEDQVD